MSWRAYFASYSILSPIHVGYHTISHAERTRYYVPANNMMGAFAGALAGGSHGLLEKVRSSFLFSTFFVSKNGIDALYPVLDEGGDLYYGKDGLSLWDFTNQYISAKEAQKYGVGKNLSEIEFIVPKNNILDKQNYLVGYIFASDGADKENGLEAWLRSLNSLSIGEETENRLGSIELVKLEQLVLQDEQAPFFGIDGVFVDWSGDAVTAVYTQPGPLLGHLRGEAERYLTSIYGVKEALEGSFDLLRGVPLEGSGNQCWVPGTLIKPDARGVSFKMGSNGVWSISVPEDSNVFGR